MNTLGVVVSTPHLVLKFPIWSTKVGVIHVDQKEAQRCYYKSLRKKGKEAKCKETQKVYIVEIDRSKNIT